jgi:hypothetical protein
MKTRVKFIGGEKVVWKALRRAFGKGHRADVAVAFLGGGAFARLKLSKGSVLVVNASEEVVRNGLTDPREIQKFRKRGVRVFSDPALHAKLFVLASRVFIGSANVSNKSAGQLAEAVVSTNDSATVAQARRFVKSRAHTEIGPEYLKSLLKTYRPPRISIHGDTRQKESDFIWAIHLPIRVYTKAAQSAVDRGERKAKRKMRRSRYFTLDDFQCSGKDLSRVNVGDTVLQRVRDGSGPFRLYPLGMVVDVEEFEEDGYHSGIVFLECQKGVHKIALKRFQDQVGVVADPLRRLKDMKRLTNKTLLSQLRRRLGSKL